MGGGRQVSSYKGAETPGKSSASVAQEEKANDAVEPTVSDEKCVRLDSERFLDVLRRALGGEEESSGESDGSEGWDESEGVEEEEASTSAASGRVAQGRTTSGQDAEEGGLEDLGMDELMALMDKELEVESPLKVRRHSAPPHGCRQNVRRQQPSVCLTVLTCAS